MFLEQFLTCAQNADMGVAMLILNRKLRERVIITDTGTGERITVAVVLVGRDQVKLGIEASRRFSVHREEVQDKIEAKR